MKHDAVYKVSETDGIVYIDSDFLQHIICWQYETNVGFLSIWPILVLCQIDYNDKLLSVLVSPTSVTNSNSKTLNIGVKHRDMKIVFRPKLQYSLEAAQDRSMVTMDR